MRRSTGHQFASSLEAERTLLSVVMARLSCIVMYVGGTSSFHRAVTFFNRFMCVCVFIIYCFLLAALHELNCSSG